MPAKIAIFGAGISGLAAGRELVRRGFEVDVYEAADRVGGLAKTFRDDDGFVYDNGPRFMFSTLAEKLGIAEQCEPVRYWEEMQLGSRSYRFPFGFARNPRFVASLGLATVTRTFRRRPQNLQQFLELYYGRLFARRTLIPLIEKWTGVATSEVSLDFSSRLLPANLGYLIHSLVKKLPGGRTEDYYRVVSRSSVPFSQILDNLRHTAADRPIVIQSLFMRINGKPLPMEQQHAYCDRLREIVEGGGQIKQVQIYTVARPPAEDWVTPLSPPEIDALVEVVRRRTGLPTAGFYG